MKPIQMVDLSAQYAKIKSEIDEAMRSVVESTAFINGPEVGKFAEELAQFLKVKNVIPCANGTDALQIALMALNLKRGDEVIVPNFTFIATVETLALLGLTPIFADIDLDTFNISPKALEEVVTRKTKAIIPVHIFGQCANMEAIIDFASKQNLFIIEDNAQALGANYIFSNAARISAGTLGHIGATSFYPSKNLGCYGDGGAIFTNDAYLAKRIALIANHGQKEHYYYEEIGVNSRLDSLQAAILRVKLRKLNEYNNARIQLAYYYDKAFKNCPQVAIPKQTEYSTHIFHQYTLRILDGQRDALQKYLADKGIPTAIFYPLPISKQKAYCNFPNAKNEFPNTETACAQVLSLPMHTEMQQDQREFIIEAILSYFR